MFISVDLPAPFCYLTADGGTIVPATIFARRTAIFLRNEAGPFGLILPSPTPPFFRLNVRSPPPLNWPFCAPLMARFTPVSTRLAALGRVCVPRYYWWTPRPVPQMPLAFAASCVPSPHGA